MSLFAAVDLGASSGRVLAAHVGPGRLEASEVRRFPNTPLRLPDGLHWDVGHLYLEILAGLRALGEAHGQPRSIGVDSWAVDYGLLDGAGRLLGLPHHYRDARTGEAVLDAVHAATSPSALYPANGLQFLPFTTLYQLAAESAAGRGALGAAATLLLIPDLLAYWLTGQRAAEVTNASTTGLLGAHDRTWSASLARLAGIRPEILPPLVTPGTVVGGLRPEAAEETGLAAGTPVTAVGSHDTASAVVGVPAEGENWAYISCGTWSLVGVELDAPVLTEDSRAAQFTNEAGVDGRTRYLHNVMGLWILQECLRTWRRAGHRWALADLLGQAAALPPSGPVVDPDAPEFLPPGDMPARVVAAARASGQREPRTPAEIVRCVLDSLAAAYARAVRAAEHLSGRRVDVVHLVGGGSRNELLCQLTADALGLPVLAGPAEATALGNVLVQARAHGAFGAPGGRRAGGGDVSLEALRALVRATAPPTRYEPTRTRTVLMPSPPWRGGAGGS
ncbi:rhamnulokinase family protein [Pseudofrankia sp. BMG5.36]|uniref:rhamnulokinase n=1 Tax=Pseudofrankia sp. BMG5.36 TaxID=1834512 RepID=UPI0008D9A89D|nr:rhamnulokinase family protein [Pseudofrankia sp. BMG5.36]OHV47835.1 carbohydrate kinase [Pseudofrankia sp. BMG5.36]